MTFSLTVGVYDSTGQTLQTSNGPYSITLTLSPSGTLSGTVTADTTNGINEFSGLTVSPAESYTITANCNGMISATTEQFTVKSLVSKIVANPSKSTVRAYESFTVNL